MICGTEKPLNVDKKYGCEVIIGNPKEWAHTVDGLGAGGVVDAAPSNPFAVPYPTRSRTPALGLVTAKALVFETSATLPLLAARLIDVLPVRSTGAGKEDPTEPPELKLTKKYDFGWIDPLRF